MNWWIAGLVGLIVIGNIYGTISAALKKRRQYQWTVKYDLECLDRRLDRVIEKIDDLHDEVMALRYGETLGPRPTFDDMCASFKQPVNDADESVRP